MMTREEILNNKYYDVPSETLNRIWIAVHEAGFGFRGVLRKSLHPGDKDLYIVFGRNLVTKEFCFWSCYNDTRQTLNHGHYCYNEFKDCFADALEFVS